MWYVNVMVWKMFFFLYKTNVMTLEYRQKMYKKEEKRGETKYSVFSMCASWLTCIKKRKKENNQNQVIGSLQKST
jgi:hypothetical protein